MARDASGRCAERDGVSRRRPSEGFRREETRKMAYKDSDALREMVHVTPRVTFNRHAILRREAALQHVADYL